MRKETINRVVLEPGKQVEIFCKRQYKGYYIRGNIYEITDRFREEESEKVYATVAYRSMMLALVNQTYQKRLKKRQKEARVDAWGFYYNTQREYLNGEKHRLLSQYSRPFDQRLLEDDLRKNTFLIDLNEAGIRESAYLDQSLRDKKDIILLEMGFTVNKVEPLSHHTSRREYLNRIYTFPAFHMPEKNKYPEDDLWRWFDEMFELLYFELNYQHMKKGEYVSILTSIGNLSYEWIQKNAISKRYLKRLNRVNRSIGDRMYPLINFCWKFLNDLVDDLTTQKQIARCQFCGDFFIYQRRWPTKKFCSLRFEGKNCRKDYNNRLDYRRHPEERKLKAREYQRKKRADKKEKTD